MYTCSGDKLGLDWMPVRVAHRQAQVSSLRMKSLLSWLKKTNPLSCMQCLFIKTVKSERESKRYRILDAWQHQLRHKHRSFVICGSWLNLDWCCSQKPKIALKGFCKKQQLCIFLWVAFKIMDMPSSTRKLLIMTICGIIYSSFKSWKIKSYSSVSKTFSQISQWAG